MNKNLNNFLPEGWTVQKRKNKTLSLLTKEGLVFSLDFSNITHLSKSQPLVKAIGFKGQALSILDVTAGWAKESFLLSQLGCDVTAVESHPFVFYFVQEALNQKEWLLGKKLNFILDNSLNYLNNLKEADRPDVIFMDPMFGGKKKSLSRKSLRILKELVGETKDQTALFNLSLKKAKRRVVVKRHRLEPPLQKNSLCSFQGRSTCYDVFAPEGG